MSQHIANNDSDSAIAPGDFAEAAEPFALFDAWFAEAVRYEPNDPNAMALATVDQQGHPNIRMVLLKGVDPLGFPDRGFVFFTNYEGTKGRELLANPYAALEFHWKSLQRQIRVRGPVTKTTVEEADAYFATRPRSSQIGAWASQQSRPLESRFALEKAVATYAAKFLIGAVPRPDYWSGFRVTPLEIEFWHSRISRLHERIVFRRSAPDKDWVKTRLYP